MLHGIRSSNHFAMATVLFITALAVLSANPAQGQGTLFVEGDNVGIGTPSPEATLHVSGGPVLLDNLQAVRVKRTTGDPQEVFSLDNTNAVVFNRGSIVANQPSLLVFAVGLNRRLEVRSSSNVPLLRVFESNGRVAFGNFLPAHPLEMSSGAHVTEGGVWQNASSRSLKKDIATLTYQEAVDALEALRPVRFRYISQPSEHHVGFIAEELPELVAEAGSRSASPMDVVAVLTAVLKEQRSRIDAQDQELRALAERLARVERGQPPDGK